jgi:hypothetical protein
MGRMWGGGVLHDARTSYGVSLWKSIRHGWGDFVRFVRFEAGNGSRIRFWYDVWCGEVALQEHYPDLISLIHFYTFKFHLNRVFFFHSCNFSFVIQVSISIDDILLSYYTAVKKACCDY